MKKSTILPLFGGLTIIAIAISLTLPKPHESNESANGNEQTTTDRSSESSYTSVNQPSENEPIAFTFKNVDTGYSYYREKSTATFYFNTSNEVYIDKSTIHVTNNSGIPVSVSDVGRSWFTIEGEFPFGQEVIFKIAKGLKNVEGKELKSNDLEIRTSMNDRNPALNFLTRGSYFPLMGRTLEMPYSVVNLTKIKVELYHSFDNNLFFDFNQDNATSYETRNRMEKIGEQEISLDIQKNQTINKMLNLSNLLPDNKKKAGFYLLKISPMEAIPNTDRWDASTCYSPFMLTDFAVNLVYDEINYSAISLYVHRLSGGEAVKNATVTVYSRKNQIAATGKTDDKGLATLTYDPAWKREDDSISAVKVMTDSEFTYCPISFDYYASDFDEKYPRKPLNEPSAFTFMERGVCRPGETFTVSSFIRSWENNQYVPMKNVPVALSIYNSQSQMIQRTMLKTDDYGFVTRDIQIPQNAPTGFYRCEFGLMDKIWGEETIYVNNYVPDRLKLSVTHKEQNNRFSFSDKIEFKASAQYYFGPNAKEINASFVPNAERATFPKHWNGWTVGSESADCLFLDNEKKSFVKADSPFTYEMPSLESLCCNSTVPVKLSCIFTANEPGGRSVTGYDSVIAYPLKHYIGLKTKSEQSNLNITMGLLGCDANKKEALTSEKTVKVTFKKIDWEYVLEKGDDAYRREWKKKVSNIPNTAFTVTIPKNAEADVWTFSKSVDLPSGHYLVTAQQQDNQDSGITEAEVWHYAGETGKRSADPHTLTFKTDAENYRPGDTAKITFRHSDTAKAFYVYGAQTIDGQQTIDVHPGENTISLKIPDSCNTGNYFAEFIIVGKYGTEYTRSIGMAELKISQEAKHRLTLNLDAPEVAKPGEDITLSLSAADATGKPASGEVFVFAVDSGVLSLTNFKTPDIFKHFYGPKGSVFNTFEMYGKLYPQLRILPDGTVAGGASFGKKIASIKKKDTAKLIAPPTIVPQSGKVTIPVRLPDHTGAMRFMAVMSNDNMVGNGEYELKLRNPITVSLTAPGTVAAGDEFQVTLRAFNNSAKASAGTITVKCPGLVDAEKVITVDTLAPESQRDYSFRTKATKNGTFTINVDYSLGNEKASASDFITVRPIFVPQTITKSLIVSPGAKTEITIPSGFECKDATVSVAASPLVYLRSALNWLNDYPYGCIEQTVSKAFPFLAIADMQKLGLISDAEAATNKSRISDAYSSILSMLRYNGAFSMWSSGEDIWPEGSIYATHFIFAAKRAKLLSPENKITDLLIQYQRSLANNTKYGRACRAYAAYVLALAGNQGGVIPARNIIASQGNDFAAFLAGAALIQSGYASEGAPAVKNGIAGDLNSGKELDALEGFGSYAAKLGMELAILSDLAISDTEPQMQKMATNLVLQLKKNNSGWGTTQANAWACYGLVAYAKHVSAGINSLNAAVAYGNGKAEALTEEQHMFVPQDKTFTITNNGKSPIFIQVKRTGTPESNDPDAIDVGQQQIHLTRTYLNQDGNQITSVKSGNLVYVKLHAQVDCNLTHLVIADLIPGGFEIEDSNLATRNSLTPNAIKPQYSQFFGKQVQKGDDRLVVYVPDVFEGAKDDIIYKIRAVTPGKYRIPQAEAEAMYQPEIKGITQPAGDDASAYITIE